MNKLTSTQAVAACYDSLLQRYEAQEKEIDRMGQALSTLHVNILRLHQQPEHWEKLEKFSRYVCAGRTVSEAAVLMDKPYQENANKDSYAGGDMGEGPAVKAASTGTLTEELDAAHNDMREKHFGSSYRKFPGGGSTQNTENECQHYSMTVNGKCNRCGHSLTAEERRFFEP